MIRTLVSRRLKTNTCTLTNQPEAYRIYLLAQGLLNRFTPDDNGRAIEYLQQALTRDPRFALAWAELSRAYTNHASPGLVALAQGPGLGRGADWSLWTSSRVLGGVWGFGFGRPASGTVNPSGPTRLRGVDVGVGDSLTRPDCA